MVELYVKIKVTDVCDSRSQSLQQVLKRVPQYKFAARNVRATFGCQEGPKTAKY